MSKVKPIHLIKIKYSCECLATCDNNVGVLPLEAIICSSYSRLFPKGTFNPKKVTCKRCLKHRDYKEALEKIKYPLLFWRGACE